MKPNIFICFVSKALRLSYISSQPKLLIVFSALIRVENKTVIFDVNQILFQILL